MTPSKGLREHQTEEQFFIVTDAKMTEGFLGKGDFNLSIDITEETCISNNWQGFFDLYKKGEHWIFSPDEMVQNARIFKELKDIKTLTNRLDKDSTVYVIPIESQLDYEDLHDKLDVEQMIADKLDFESVFKKVHDALGNNYKDFIL